MLHQKTPTRDTESALYEVYKSFCTNNPVSHRRLSYFLSFRLSYLFIGDFGDGFGSVLTNFDALSLLVRFVKFCRDTKLIGSVGRLTSVDADLIFQKSKKAGNYAKRITYEDFRSLFFLHSVSCEQNGGNS